MSESKNQKKLVAAALSRLDTLRKQEDFDPHRPGSRPTPGQQAVINDFGKVRHQFIRAGSQGGKSSTCARILTWMMTDTHPSWVRPTEWNDEPLLAIVAGRTGKQLEDSLIPRIISYLPPGSFRVVKSSSLTQRIELTNGNKIVFQSLENPVMARERLQSYTAHMAWCDELPPTVAIIAELFRGIQAREGYFIASFTPLVINLEVQRFIESIEPPFGKMYRFNMLDNPVYFGREQELLDQYSNLPESRRNAMLYGDWMSADSAVYYFNYTEMVRDLPEHYSKSWRHVESVDPALKSALGLTIWGEDPKTNEWYCIVADYVKDISVPTLLVEEVKRRTQGFNIVRRIADPHEVWYITTAQQHYRLNYMGVFQKSNRKGELIKGLQEKLGKRLFITPNCGELIHELQDCRWSTEAEEKIVNASSYHLLDSSQYFCDNIPTPTVTPVMGFTAETYPAWLQDQNRKRIEIKQREEKTVRSAIAAKLRRRSGVWR